MNNDIRPIGVFDSGVGGISVLIELVKLMPYENYIYLGDSANAPYGSRSSEEVESLVLSNAKILIDQGCKCLVIACNTATAAAIDMLRHLYTNIPVIGIEPALKPAVTNRPLGRILVMATEVTLREPKFLRLVAQHSNEAQILTIPAKGLVEFIENGRLDTPELEAFLTDLLSEYQHHPVDALVLGCTHYPFVKNTIQKVLGDNVLIVDGGNGTARETMHQLISHNLNASSHNTGSVLIQNSNPDKILLSQQLLESR